MNTINFRQLIDLAIGSPEPGHVNFYALHLLLYSIVEKLNVIDENVDCARFGCETTSIITRAVSDICLNRRSDRLTGGADPDAAEDEATQPEETPAPIETEEGAEIAPAAAEPGLDESSPPVEAVAATPEVIAPPTAPPEIVVSAPEPPATPAPPAPPAPPANANVLNSINQLETRLSRVEDTTEIPKDLQRGIAIMKDQLELTMEQMYKLTAILVHPKLTAEKIGRVRALAKKLRSMQKENVYIEGTNRFKLEDERSLSWLGSEELDVEAEHMMDDAATEGGVEMQSHSSRKSIDSVTLDAAERAANDQFDMELHMCYSPEKMLDLLLELKSEFCMLASKVNELSAMILAQDSNRTQKLIQELQEHVRELRLTLTSTRGQLDKVDGKLVTNIEAVENLRNTVMELNAEKVDKTELTILLADKVDYEQLQRKVSKEQMQELQCRIEKQLCELQKLINSKESNIMEIIAEMRKTLGINVVEEILRQFKQQVTNDIEAIRLLLKEYMDATNDDCAAAGTRIKVMQDLACFSCDTTCVMRTMERSKVAKLSSAKASNLISPLITYELGTIRKSGIMGYYRKDEFPHAPNAWMERQQLNANMCHQRHAGGPHTTHTAKEHVEKVLQKPK